MQLAEFALADCQGFVLAHRQNFAGGSIAKGTVLLAFYAIGLGIPFLLFAIFINKLDRTLKFVKRYFKKIERVMGLLLWTVGLLMLTGGFSSISFWLLETFPSLGALG